MTTIEFEDGPLIVTVDGTLIDTAWPPSPEMEKAAREVVPDRAAAPDAAVTVSLDDPIDTVPVPVDGRMMRPKLRFAVELTATGRSRVAELEAVAVADWACATEAKAKHEVAVARLANHFST